MVDIHITVTGPVHVHEALSTEQIRAVVTEELATALTPLGDMLMSQFSDLKAALTDFFADLTAKLAALQASIDSANSESHLTVEDQADFDAVKDLVAAKDAELGDADGSESPPQPL